MALDLEAIKERYAIWNRTFAEHEPFNAVQEAMAVAVGDIDALVEEVERLREALKQVCDDMAVMIDAQGVSLGNLQAKANLRHYRSLLLGEDDG